MSFGVIVAIVAAATLSLIGLAVLKPAYLLPGAIGVGALGLARVIVPRVLKRAASSLAGGPAAASYGLHVLGRVKAMIEAFNGDEKADVPRLVDYMLQQAVLHQASDVHLIPYREFLLVRYRIDGILADVAKIGLHLREGVTNRLKVMARVVLFVHDRPQDGRLELTVAGRGVDLRAAFMPTLHGERVVLRILDGREVGLGLESLGMTPNQLSGFDDIVMRPQGMVILNGPAGSGKTTTIYAALRAILERSQFGRSIYTLEDPIEYDLMNINQTQIEETRGFTFAQGLRTMLRQDPDVIMVGEIRDLDTARIAVQAGMTGHLIITTVHAKRAAGVFVRLVEIGVDPHSVASAVTAVVAQRLVRRLCTHCRRKTRSTPGQEAKLGRNLGGDAFYAPTGCPACGNKGFSGRTGVFEILQVDEGVRDLVSQRASPDAIHQRAVEHGMSILIDNGLRLARAGETSLDEVLRVLPPEQRGT
jgi:general secretion pathway protein E